VHAVAGAAGSAVDEARFVLFDGRAMEAFRTALDGVA
jgi:hypothetical protein